MSNSQFPSFFPLSFSLHRGANCSVPSFLTERLLVWIKAHIVASVPNLRLPKQEHTHMVLQTDTHTHTVLNNHQTTFYKPLALSTLMVVNLKMRCQMWFWTPLAFSDHFLKAYWPPWNAKNYKKNSSSISSRFPCWWYFLVNYDWSSTWVVTPQQQDWMLLLKNTTTVLLLHPYEAGQPKL